MGKVRDNLAVHDYRFKNNGPVVTFYGHVNAYKHFNFDVAGGVFEAVGTSAVSSFGTHGLVDGLLRQFFMQISYTTSALARPKGTTTDRLPDCGLGLHLNRAIRTSEYFLLRTKCLTRQS